jgi:hypothetical protein
MFTTFKDASRYTRNYAKGYYRLLVRELHLKKQLLNHGFLLVKLKSSWLGQPVRNICVENDHDYVLLVVSTFWSIPHSWFITWFVIRVTRRVPLVEQELTTLPEHLRAPPDFRGVRIARALVFCVVFVDRCLSLCPFLLAIVLSVPTRLRILITPLISSTLPNVINKGNQRLFTRFSH